MDSKNILLSKTFWTNIIALLVVIAGAQGLVVDPDQQGALVAGVMAGVNIVLRLMTDSPAHLPGSNGGS